MLRVLQVVTKMDRGGLETMLMNYYRNIDRSKVQFDYLVHRKERGRYDDEIEMLGGKIYRVPPLNPLNPNYYKALNQFFREHEYRIVHSNLDCTSTLPVKTLVSVRNDPNKEYAGKIGRFVGKVLLPMADGCVFQTSDAQKWFPERLQKKSRIIYNAVKEEFYQVERTPVRGEIVTCGRLTEQKNHRLLIDAFAEVQKIHPYATLKIYGEGALREKLQNQIESLNLNEKVFLMGATNDVAKVLQTADLFVLSSDYEGMPNALMEAMAAGVPCISTDCPCGGPRELFGNLCAEDLVRCNEPKQLAQTMEKKLEQNDQSCMQRKRAEQFRPEKINYEWKKYINELIVT